MKILQLTYESLGSPFGFGGAGVRVYEIYKRLKHRHEAHPVSVIEAMACEKAVIVSDIPEFCYLVNNGTEGKKLNRGFNMGQDFFIV